MPTLDQRSIPAHAGETRASWASLSMAWVDPRSRGGDVIDRGYTQ